MNRFIAILLLLSGCSLPVRPAAVGITSTGERSLKKRPEGFESAPATPAKVKFPRSWCKHAGDSKPTARHPEITEKTLTTEPAPVNPYAALTWTHPAKPFPFQHIVWQSDMGFPVSQFKAVAIVTTPCDATGTNFCIDLPRTNSQAFYRVSAQWR